MHYDTPETSEERRGNVHRHYTLDEVFPLLDPANAPPRNDLASSNNDSSRSWDLNTGYDQSWELVCSGWQEKAQQLNEVAATIHQLLEEAHGETWDVSGECVDVGRFLSGEPECMLSMEQRIKKPIHISLNISARCSVDSDRLLNRGAAIAAVVIGLQRRGIPVRLTVEEWVSTRDDCGQRFGIEIELNRFQDYLDPARFAYWLAHPAALRRSLFRLEEHEPADVRRKFGFSSHCGYGYPANAPPEAQTSSKVVIPWAEGRNYSTPEEAFGTIKAALLAQGIEV